jgi:hypothetical protein
MKRRNHRLVLVAVVFALAFGVLPAASSAGAPQIHCPNSAPSCSITITGGSMEVSTTGGFNNKLFCQSLTGTGTLTTTGGAIEVSFLGCKDNLTGWPCATPGGGGAITTTVLPFDNIYSGDNKLSPGVLLTPSVGTSHFLTFNCLSLTYTVVGNGWIGSLTGPECGGSGATLAASFSWSMFGHQTLKQVTGTGTIFDMSNGANTFAIRGSMSITTSEGGKFTVTCV